jgi:hypothetical protein
MDRYVARITWRRALKVFWAQAWRATVVVAALGLAMVLTYGVVSPLLRELIGQGELIIRAILLLALCVYAATWGTKRALQAHYSDFRIDATPLDAAPPAEPAVPLAMTEAKAIVVWWATFWRTYVITIPLNLLTNYLIVGTPVPARAMQLPLLLATYVVQTFIAVAVGAWAMRLALQLDYGGWRLQLVSTPA